MNILQKFFYRFTKEYKQKKSDNWDKLWDFIDAKEKQLRDKQYEEQQKHNNICPNCRSEKDKIVNKIQRVHGETRGSFHIIGGGSVYGWVDTDGVNHCNNCGNQWIKHKWETIDRDKVVWKINYELVNSQTWEHYLPIRKELEPFYAESLDRLFNGWIEYSSIPTKSWLLQTFKSIYE